MDTQTISQLIVAVSRGLVDEKDAVNVTVDEPAEDGTVVFHLHVAADTMPAVLVCWSTFTEKSHTMLLSRL